MVKYRSQLEWRPALKCLNIGNSAHSQLYTQKYFSGHYKLSYEMDHKYRIASSGSQMELCTEVTSEEPAPMDLSRKSSICKTSFTMNSQSQSPSSTISTIDSTKDCTYVLPLDLSVKPVEDTTNHFTLDQPAAECDSSQNLCDNISSRHLYHSSFTSHAPKLYKCYMCEKTYRQARDYRAHIAAHKNSSVYKCDICPCVLPNTSDYLQHLKEHKQKDLHCCTHCGKYFRDGCTLTTHVRTHTGEKPYKCEICNKQFRQSGTYRRHKKVHLPRMNRH